MSIKSVVKQILVKQQNKQYEKALSRRRMTYREWLLNQQSFLTDKVPVSDENKFVMLCPGEGDFCDDAANQIESFLKQHPEAEFVYADEDLADENGNCEMPWFKPDWSPDLLDGCLYFGSFLAVRQRTWEEVKMSLADVLQPGKETFPLYYVTEVAVYEKWLHECLKEKQAYCKNSHMVGHIAKVLFHGNKENGYQRYLQKSEYLSELEKKERTFITAQNFLSIIIPSKDNPALLRQCLCAIEEHSEQIPYEIIVVDNGSSEENRKEIASILTPHTYLYYPMEFHFSKMCNLGAQHAKGNQLLFLNDDVVLGMHCLTEMMCRSQREYTGAVGLKLLYPDSDRIQHAGITNLPMGPVHKLQFQEDYGDYYFGANHGARNCLAVTAACLMVAKDKFYEVGGFSDELRVAFNDVDFCFSLYEAGYFNVCINDVHGWHHESLSRGSDEAIDKLNRLLRERQKLYERHPALEGVDPYYSVNLAREGLDTGIRPAYETDGNRVQEAIGIKKIENPQDCRKDDCLMARVESYIGGILTGYGVVLGDNNACYERYLLLIEETKKSLFYKLKLEGQYRPDLAENLPDQERVALCGYRVRLDKACIPQGKYRVGMIAGNKVTGLKLQNITNWVIEL